MPIYRYKALSETGKKISGAIDADSLELAKEKLRQSQIMVTKLLVQGGKKEPTLKPTLLLAFTRELSQLLKAGLPLYDSLLTIEEKYRRHRSHPIFLELCDQLKGGHLLSKALSAFPKTFDPIYISMVKAGEQTGSLSWAFDQLYELIERRQKLKKQLISAMAYPAFLGSFCFIVIVSLMLFVIPSMQELFEGRQLHPLTQTILALSQFLHRQFITLLLLLTAVVGASWAYFRRPGGRKNFHKFLQKIPLVKTVLLQAALIRFCRSTSILIRGGVPLVNALTLSRQAMKHALLEEAVSGAENALVEGRPLSQELAKSPHIPPLVVRMLSLSEETGQLPEILQNLSDIYDQELERSLTHITTFLQPILLLILGGVVGLVILSILLPLSDVSSLISN